MGLKPLLASGVEIFQEKARRRRRRFLFFVVQDGCVGVMWLDVGHLSPDRTISYNAYHHPHYYKTQPKQQVYDEIKGDVSAALLALIAREREGEAIDQGLIAAGVSCLDNSACSIVLVCVCTCVCVVGWFVCPCCVSALFCR